MNPPLQRLEIQRRGSLLQWTEYRDFDVQVDQFFSRYRLREKSRIAQNRFSSGHKHFPQRTPGIQQSDASAQRVSVAPMQRDETSRGLTEQRIVQGSQ